MDEDLREPVSQILTRYLRDAGISLTESQYRFVLNAAESRAHSCIYDIVLDSVRLAGDFSPKYEMSVTAEELQCLRFTDLSHEDKPRRWFQRMINVLGAIRPG